MAYDLKNANNVEEYIRFKPVKKVGEKKGKVEVGNYGSRKGDDNMIYSDRGQKDPDAARLKEQNLPNNRLYTYVE